MTQKIIPLWKCRAADRAVGRWRAGARGYQPVAAVLLSFHAWRMRRAQTLCVGAACCDAAPGCRGQLAAAAFDVADEISDRTDLIGFIVGDFHAKSILDSDHQFETVEPGGPEIFGEVRVVDHVLDRDPQVLGDKSTDFP